MRLRKDMSNFPDEVVEFNTRSIAVIIVSTPIARLRRGHRQEHQIGRNLFPRDA